MWLHYGIFLIKENVSIYVCIYIITREIGKFNTGNYEIRELLYVNMKNIRKCWVSERSYYVKY